ncbi:MAG: VTT domain-containing protein [Candidatus Bathyarchaeota archaeon]|nr:VTT domain-containing protein [Candidatus Bathyarchaeota archaeon]
MASFIELLIVLLSAFGLNLIPFAGPSNLFIASTAALGIANADATTLVAIGFLVALGASLAKSVHYMVTFFIGKRLSENRRRKLDVQAKKVKKWAFLLLFSAAASPIPDEPVVVPLGLMKYSPVKFFSAFFLGKITITIAGAFLGDWVKGATAGWISSEVMIAISIVLTIVVTVVLLKVDIDKWLTKIFKRKTIPEEEPQADA